MHQLIETFSNTPHLHLILNHVPTVGFGVALALLLLAQIRKNDDLTRTSLVLFFCVAVLSIATYLSGKAAAIVLRGPDSGPGFPSFVASPAIAVHEDAALLALIFMEVTGFFAWLALWRRRRLTHVGTGSVVTVLILSIVTFGLMARAAELGGAIHHPEILEAAATATKNQTADSVPAEAQTPGGATSTASTPGGAGLAGGLSGFVTTQTWVWPTLETLHFVGLSMLFTVVLIVDLRILGMIKSVPCAAVYQLLPIGILGFGINLVTGMMFFIGEPAQYVNNPVFYWKIVFIVLGGLNVAYFLLDENVWNVKGGDDAPLSSKVAAASAIGIWAVVLFCGHMLPFLGTSF